MNELQRRKKEILKTLEDCVMYYDGEILTKDKEVLWELFLEGKIESRIVTRHGEPMAEIMKPLDLSKL